MKLPKGACRAERYSDKDGGSPNHKTKERIPQNSPNATQRANPQLSSELSMYSLASFCRPLTMCSSQSCPPTRADTNNICCQYQERVFLLILLLLVTSLPSISPSTLFFWSHPQSTIRLLVLLLLLHLFTFLILIFLSAGKLCIKRSLIWLAFGAQGQDKDRTIG